MCICIIKPRGWVALGRSLLIFLFSQITNLNPPITSLCVFSILFRQSTSVNNKQKKSIFNMWVSCFIHNAKQVYIRLGQAHY